MSGALCIYARNPLDESLTLLSRNRVLLLLAWGYNARDQKNPTAGDDGEEKGRLAGYTSETSVARTS